VRAGLNLLLTDHGNLFTRDFFLPTGDLRDQKKSYRRADIIVVTKCPPELTAAASRALISEIRPKEGQQVLFTILEYGRPYHISQRTERTIDEGSEVLLVTGIAHPAPLKKMLEESTSFYKWLSFPDHHIFSPDDWQEIHTAFRALTGSDRFILTTEKDAVRLEKFMRPGEDLPLFVIPVRHRFLFGGDAELERSVLSYIDTFNRPKP
jgi:tetraacyldisaccharide 4'-kinase